MEWFSELIGFFIILLVFFVPLLRKLLVDKKKTEQKEEEVFYEQEEEELSPPPPKIVRSPLQTDRLVKKDFEFHTEVEEWELESKIEERILETQEAPHFKERIVSRQFILEKKKRRRKKNVIDSIVKKRDPLQAMVILSAIFEKQDL